MSVYATRYGAGHLGFFDFANHIVLVPDGDVEPRVVIEHESTHINVANYSVVGVVEDAVRIIWDGALRDNDQAVQRLHQLRTQMQRHCEQVHEAAAWFCTEAWLRDPEPAPGPATPLGYAADTRRIWNLLKPPPGSQARPTTAAIDLIETCASRALSPPALGQLCESGSPLEDLSDALAPLAGGQSPISRFRQLVQQAATMSPQAAQDWCDDLWDRSEASGPVPWTARGALGKDAAPRLLRRLSKAAGLPLTEQDAERVWQAHRVLRYQPRLDRYAQICVVQPNQPTQPSAPLLSFYAELEGRLLVSIHGAGGHDFEPSSGMLVKHGHVGMSWQRTDNGEAGTMTLERSQVREAVSNPQCARVIASKGYDFGRGELAGAVGPVLANVPHAVVAVVPFLALWRSVGIWAATVGGSPGIAGATTIESAVVPSGFGADYAYLLLKPASRDWPIVVIPMVAHGIQRALAWAHQPDVIAGGKLTLKPATAPSLRAWAGQGLPHLCGALAMFEGWFYTNSG